MPQMLDPRRVFADEPVLEVVNSLLNRFIRTDTISLADTVQMFVGNNFDKDVIAVTEVNAVSQNVCDLHDCCRGVRMSDCWPITSESRDAGYARCCCNQPPCQSG